MSDPEHDTYSYIKTNKDYWDQQYPGVFRPIPKSHQSLAQPTPPRKSRPKPAPLPLRKPERAGDVIVIPLPLPHKILHKNGRTKNYKWKASVTKAARNAALTMAYLVRPKEPWQAVRIDLTFWVGRKHDDDGLIHWAVPYRDGIAEAIGVNDANFQQGRVSQFVDGSATGRREVEITLTRLQ
jgi:crossover junction endodeoxyribonuclease RusA